jgi:hypothetical protein
VKSLKKITNSTIADDSPEPAATPAACSSSHPTAARAAADAEPTAGSNHLVEAATADKIYAMLPSVIETLDGMDARVACNLNQKRMGVSGGTMRKLRRRALDHAVHVCGHTCPTRAPIYTTVTGKRYRRGDVTP